MATEADGAIYEADVEPYQKSHPDQTVCATSDKTGLHFVIFVRESGPGSHIW